MNKVKFQQRIGSNSIVITAFVNHEEKEMFFIKQVDETSGMDWFAVTSTLGVDTYENDLSFSTIEKAIQYIKTFATKSREY